jgi:hypothetical protein
MIVDTARTALEAGKVLELTYSGFSRCVEVHAIGISKKEEIIMVCWQLRGGSVTSEPVGWKMMKLSEVEAAAVIEEVSEAPRHGYRKGDRRMTRIICEL